MLGKRICLVLGMVIIRKKRGTRIGEVTEEGGDNNS